MTTLLPDLAGVVGVALIVGSYLALQTGRLDPRALRYSMLNAAGAALVIVSLLVDFNLPALMVEVFWLAVSLYGILRWRRHRAVRARP